MMVAVRRLVAAIVAGLFGLAAIFLLVRFLLGQTLEDAGNWADVIAGVLAAITFGLTIVRFLANRAVAPPPSNQLVFGVVPREARWFQQRPAEQKALRQALADNNHVGLVALPGARGAGKTQLAAAYARKCVADGFEVVAWINAQTISESGQADRLLGPVTELARLGAELGLDTADRTPEQVAEAAIRALSVRDGKRRLLVFDNVDDPDSIADYLPATGTTKVVITTNRQEVTAMDGVTPIRVEMFTVAQGRAFLTQATTLPDTDETVALGNDLGWLPLGLAQAAAVIGLNRWSYQDYRQRLAEVDVSRALVRLAGAQHPGVLAATRLSLQTLQRQDPSGDACRLLAVLSLLAPEGTSRAFLKDPQAIAALELDDLDRALSALVNASLITLNGDPLIVTVHRLTAKVVRHQAADLVTQAADMLIALAEQLDESQVAHRRNDLNELVAHIYTLRTHIDQPTVALCWLADWAGRLLRALGDVAGAIALYEQNLAVYERLGGADHPDTLTSRNNLATSYRTAGRLNEAIALHEQNLADCERLLGTEHAFTLTSRNNLALSYWAADRHDEAIALHEQNLADRERLLGTEHPATLLSRNNLAESYRAAGRLNKAIALHERNLADSERLLGTEHPATLLSRNNLAESYRAAGRHDEAQRLSS